MHENIAKPVLDKKGEGVVCQYTCHKGQQRRHFSKSLFLPLQLPFRLLESLFRLGSFPTSFLVFVRHHITQPLFPKPGSLLLFAQGTPLQKNPKFFPWIPISRPKLPIQWVQVTLSNGSFPLVQGTCRTSCLSAHLCDRPILRRQHLS